jgi:hypothetical protein
MSLAFFISAGAEPLEPGPDTFGTGTAIILYDAPSEAAAEKWAANYARQMLLEVRPDQKLAYLNLLPLRDSIITPTGERKIEWSSFAELTNTMSGTDAYNGEFHQTLGMVVSKERNLQKAEDFDVEKFKQQVPDPGQYNWDPQKSSHYVLHHDTQAVVVEEINLFVAMVRHGHVVMSHAERPKNIQTRVWPGAMKYSESLPLLLS